MMEAAMVDFLAQFNVEQMLSEALKGIDISALEAASE